MSPYINPFLNYSIQKLKKKKNIPHVGIHWKKAHIAINIPETESLRGQT